MQSKLAFFESSILLDFLDVDVPILYIRAMT